jgi:hypothetical protein
MNFKKLIILVLGFVFLKSLSAQDNISFNYEFVNSIYQNHIKNGLEFYYLYYKPIGFQFIAPLKDTLSSYASEKDILFIKKQIEYPDTSYKWIQDSLVNCKVIQDKTMRELQSKNTHSSAMIVDALTGKPIKKSENVIVIPAEEKQFYYFTTPAWNIDSTLVIFGAEMDEGNHGEIRTSIYKKVDYHWIKLTQLPGLDWMKQ